MLRTLRAHLVAGHALVAVVATVLTFLAVRLVAPSVLAHQGHPAGAGHAGGGTGAATSARQELLDAVTTSLQLGTALALVVAVALGWWLAVRLARPVEASAATARAQAQGRWDVRVEIPRERELAELAGAVNALGERLGSTEAARVELLREVSHEMRTPLSVARAGVEGMLDGVLARDDDELRGLHSELLRLQRLTEDLSQLSRSAEAGASIRPVPADLAAVALPVAETFRARAIGAGVELVVDRPEAPVPVVVDADRIGQVVANLLGNALRATSAEGRVTVSVREEDGRGAGGRWAVLQVVDTGRGLDAEELGHVFERFWRGAADRVQEGSGTGIGLTISRDIARAHGGDLRLGSAGPGQGCLAELVLPCA